MVKTVAASRFSPASSGELSEILRDATEHSTPLVPRGGGTALSIGNVEPGAPAYLDITSIAGVRDYRPADLTLSVHAGTRMADVRAILAEHGQELPIDFPNVETSTIGGLVASGFAGPRRLGSGTLKDLIIGCEYVRGDGLIAKAGGQVVKNVSGFEISRLMHGSWGSLAVLTTVNFKVTPIPKAERTLTWHMKSPEAAIAAAHRVRQEQPSVTAIDVHMQGEATTLNVRLMGRTGALESQIAELTALHGASEPLPDEQSHDWWQDQMERFAHESGKVQIVLSTRPRFMNEAFAEFIQRMGLRNEEIVAVVSPGLGTARIRLEPAAVTAGSFWEKAGVSSIPGGAKVLIEFAPDEWKRGIDVWGAEDEGFGLMRAVKAQFDPAAILNRGRLFI
jgi:glycolate oxidase FAD binding subunit